MMFLPICIHTGVEYWIESDMEIDEDIQIEEANVPPPDVSLVQESPEKAELNIIVRWIITLLSIFQTQFFLTDRALKWLLKFLSVLLGFLGRYSTKVAELAARLPQSIYQFNHSASDLIPGSTFERRAVCRACDSLYTFKDCLKRVGSRTTVVRCAQLVTALITDISYCWTANLVPRPTPFSVMQRTQKAWYLFTLVWHQGYQCKVVEWT